jgi:hypothetical protein
VATHQAWGERYRIARNGHKEVDRDGQVAEHGKNRQEQAKDDHHHVGNEALVGNGVHDVGASPDAIELKHLHSCRPQGSWPNLTADGGCEGFAVSLEIR